ncbi:flagellar basal-body rod protein FlgG, partial [Pseudomonadales bacterium]|nr:flagellar basal-body rod protein FlgG [Pseudomonadales bacterium]
RQPGGQSSQNTQLPTGLQLGTGVRVVSTQKEFSTGTLQVTDQPLDMAIDGRGFYEILMPDGSTAYTRNGEFSLSADGEIVNSDGFQLQPAIAIPNSTLSVTVARDGTVSALVAGNSAPTQVGSIQLSDFLNPSGLQAVGSNLYLETASSGAAQQGTPATNGFGSIEQGMVENSNVNIVEELVNMITTQRTYEMNSKVIQTADQMLQFVSQNI